MTKNITFDRFVRGCLIIGSIAVSVLLFKYLSPVIVPFLISGIIAYLLNPVVNFLQNTCHLRWRGLCVIITLLLAGGIVTGLLWLCIPPMIEESAHLKDVVRSYLERGGLPDNATVPEAVRHFFNLHVQKSDLKEYLQSDDGMDLLKNVLPRLWQLLYSTVGMAISFVASLISLLYLFFLLLDYERYAKGWIKFIPPRRRAFARQLVDDTTYYMCGYFRGQLGIALSNCVMFTTGFLIIGFPMPVALGCLIGIISFVPYLQVAGILPAAILALLRAAETGANFWIMLGGVLLVYLVVQIIQDVIVTPRIMGKIMGLSPAIILLALSVGAYVMGIGGLILALPVTTLALTYYKRYTIKESEIPDVP